MVPAPWFKLGAIAVLATIPVFLLFWLLQRGVNRGFGLSGLK